MVSDAAAVVGELPLLPPVKTSPSSREKPLALANCEVVKEAQKEEGECLTPRSEEHVIKPSTVCPPAPRKPRPAKRTASAETPSMGLHALVPRDLTSIFLPLPPKKRIRVC